MKDFLLCTLRQPIDGVLPLARAHRAGVEMQAFFLPAVLDDPRQLLARHLQALDGFAAARALHGPFADLCPGSGDALVRGVARHRITQALPLVEALQIRHLVLHHGYVPHTTPAREWVAQAAAFWREVLALLPPRTCVHLENYLEASPEVILRVIEAVGDPRLGHCLDIGHAHAFSRTPVVEWIRSAGSRISYAHLHDNDGGADQHLPLGQGTIPLADVLAALETHAPAASWSLEADAGPSLAWLRAHGYRREPPERTGLPQAAAGT